MTDPTPEAKPNRHLGFRIAVGLVGLFAGPIVLAVAWMVSREWAAHLDEDKVVP